jgi:SAM-dependent methyltransferase
MAAIGDRLLLACLARGVNPDVELELLLTGVRKRLLCDVEVGELGRQPMPAFVCALIRQCANNEYVFFVSAEEYQRIGTIAGQWRQRPGPAGDGIQDHMLLALYGPVVGLLAERPDAVDVARIRPKAFRDIVTEALAAEDEERRLVSTIGRLGAIDGDVSRRVAAQYEANPYPRWLSTAVPAPTSKRDHLRRFVDEPALAFFDRPFDVLIAGCGTGQHAIQAAFGYGPQARLVATDLSLASLAYGARMAGALGAGNIQFLQADILDMAGMGQDFDVIECVGVLHHMADPAEGWRRLAERLRPGGLMRVGLYSELGRQDIARFREARAGTTEADDDDTIRRIRREIIDGDSDGGTWGEGLAGRFDFFTMSACRDLLFHTQERRMTAPEIGGQLAALGLEFRGFDVATHVRDRFRERFPEDDAWLDLRRWEIYEQEQPSTFRGMYRFWCRKTPAGE